MNEFGGTGWSRSLETAYREGGEHILKSTPLEVDTRVVESVGQKENIQGLFMQVLSDSQRFSEVETE